MVYPNPLTIPTLAPGFARARAELLYFRRPMERPKELVPLPPNEGEEMSIQTTYFPNGDGKIPVIFLII